MVDTCNAIKKMIEEENTENCEKDSYEEKVKSISLFYSSYYLQMLRLYFLDKIYKRNIPPACVKKEYKKAS